MKKKKITQVFERAKAPFKIVYIVKTSIYLSLICEV